jgi:hypothetical protein
MLKIPWLTSCVIVHITSTKLTAAGQQHTAWAILLHNSNVLFNSSDSSMHRRSNNPHRISC